MFNGLLDTNPIAWQMSTKMKKKNCYDGFWPNLTKLNAPKSI